MEIASREGDLVDSPPDYSDEITSSITPECSNELFNSTVYKNEVNNFILPKTDESDQIESIEKMTSLTIDLSPLSTGKSEIIEETTGSLFNTETDLIITKLESIDINDVIIPEEIYSENELSNNYQVTLFREFSEIYIEVIKIFYRVQMYYQLF